MIHIVSLAFGPFQEVEPLNRGFSPGHAKMRITVDAETQPTIPETQLLDRLNQAFPGLARHQCRAGQNPGVKRNGEAGIVLLESESSANQAHLLEHLTLEIIAGLNGAARLSGVTCAYAMPPWRNDVFVECTTPRSGALSVTLALEAVNAALADVPLHPLYPDAVRSVRELKDGDDAVWQPSRLARHTGLPEKRAALVLELLARIEFLEEQSYSLNISGEAHYRMVIDPSSPAPLDPS